MENPECCICYEELQLMNDDNWIKLPCKHCYHIECINAWWKKIGISSTPSCPYCKRSPDDGLYFLLVMDEIILMVTKKDRGYFDIDWIIFAIFSGKYNPLNCSSYTIARMIQRTCYQLRRIICDRIDNLTNRNYFIREGNRYKIK